jgi:hypothetical protein
MPFISIDLIIRGRETNTIGNLLSNINIIKIIVELRYFLDQGLTDNPT